MTLHAANTRGSSSFVRGRKEVARLNSVNSRQDPRKVLIRISSFVLFLRSFSISSFFFLSSSSRYHIEQNFWNLEVSRLIHIVPRFFIPFFIFCIINIIYRDTIFEILRNALWFTDDDNSFIGQKRGEGNKIGRILSRKVLIRRLASFPRGFYFFSFFFPFVFLFFASAAAG